MASEDRSPRPHPASLRPVIIGLTVVVALYLAWWFLQHGGDADARYGDLFFPAVDVLAAALAWRARRLCGDVPGLRRFWGTVALAMALLALSDLIQLVYDVSSDDPPYPSWADALYLAFYPVMFLAFIGLPIPQGMRAAVTRTVLDATITVAGGGAVVWYFVLGPAADTSPGTSLENVVTLAYPVGDLILLTALIAAYFRRSPATLRPSLQALGVGFALYIAADIIAGHDQLAGTYTAGDAVDILYMLAPCAFALAGALQRPARAGTPDAATPTAPSPISWSSVVPYVSLGVIFGLLLSQFWDEPFYPGLGLVILVIWLGVLVSVRQYAAQREASQLQRRMGMILESMGEGVITFTESGQILSANRAAEDAFLAHPDQLVGRSMESLLSNVDWEQRGTTLSAASAVGRQDSMLGTHQLLTGRRLDGSTFPLEFLVSEARIDGERILIGVGQDVSERERTIRALRESERRFRTVFDNAGMGIVVIDVSDARGANVLDVNAAFADMVGYDVEELRGNDIALTSHPTDNVMSDAKLREWLMQGTAPSYRRDIPYVRSDGSVMWGNITFSAIRSEEGIAVYVVGMVEDITQRRRVEQLKDEFVSIVGHELRTPLTSIRGSLGLLEAGVMGELPPEAGEMLTLAVSNTDRLVRLINDMLDIERMDAGRADMDLVPVRACDLIDSSCQAVAAAADEARVTLQVDADATVVVDADADRIVQALINLIGNAVKFSDAGGTVEIAAGTRDGEALFTVHDSGRGIPAADLEAIFERFHQVDGTDARDKGGTGLGLPIARGIVEHHEGRMWAESRPGEGSTFCFTLPLAPEPAPAATLLVCGGHSGDADRISELVDELGCAALRALDLEEAADLIASQRPAAVVLPADADTARWAAGVAQASAARGIPVVAIGEGAPPHDLLEGLSAWVETSEGRQGLLSALRLVVPALRRGSVLIVEDDLDLSAVLSRVLEREGSTTRVVRTAEEAVTAIRNTRPNLVILDLMLPGADGYTVVERLRGEGLLADIPLLVYTALHLEPGDRERLQLGRTEFLMKSETTPQDLEQHVARLLWRVADPIGS